MSNYLTLSQEVKVSVDEVDFLDRLKPSSIMQYLQDVATDHATVLGIGYEELKKINLFWILSKFSAEIHAYPKVGDTIFVQTFPRYPGLVESIRDYYIYDAKGNILINASSKWCVLDTIKHSIQRCRPLFSKFTEDEFNPTESLKGDSPKIEILGFDKSEQIYQNKVMISDLDRNFHMNNAKYGDLIINSFDIDYLSKHELTHFDINFLSEMKYYDTYSTRKITNNDNDFYIYANRADGKDVFSSHTYWKNYAK